MDREGDEKTNLSLPDDFFHEDVFEFTLWTLSMMFFSLIQKLGQQVLHN